jgi:hypothetical protein
MATELRVGCGERFEGDDSSGISARPQLPGELASVGPDIEDEIDLLLTKQPDDSPLVCECAGRPEDLVSELLCEISDQRFQ